MSAPVGPIYASTLSRRDRAWRTRRRGYGRVRFIVVGGGFAAVTTVLLQHLI
jgi:hypothetical protein